MRITIKKSEVKGLTPAPSSKSYTIRALMCSALANGHSQILQPLHSDDTQAAVRVLNQIGVKTEESKDKWDVRGGIFKAPAKDLCCGDSAATLRFMTAICAKVPRCCVLTAGPSLSKRPVDLLVRALNQWGIEASCQEKTAPVTVKGGTFKGGATYLAGNVSSQFVSALLLIAPLAQMETKIHITTPLESRSYVLMTLECLNQFGISMIVADEMMSYTVVPQLYHPATYEVEGDWSSVSYLLGLGALAGETQVSNLNLNSLQGDRTILDLLKKMGARVTSSGDTLTVTKSELRAIKVDLNDCIDLLPTVAVLAALAEGTSELTGIERARFKESNRISAIREGLEKAGIRVTESLDKMTIAGGKPVNALIDSKNDHRIAMAFSLMGAYAGNIAIDGAECVTKTYPEYWQTIRKLGVKIDE